MRSFWVHSGHRLGDGSQYVVYGPLANGATRPYVRRRPHFQTRPLWRIVAKYGVHYPLHSAHRHRAFMKLGTEWPKKHDLSSLRLLAPWRTINPEPGSGTIQVIGNKRCPIVDTWVADRDWRHFDYSCRARHRPSLGPPRFHSRIVPR